MFQTKKLILLLLAMIMVLSVFAGCTPATQENPGSDTTDTGDVTDETTGTGNGTGNGHPNVKFKGEALNVYAWKPGNVDEYVKEVSEESSVVDKAIYDRCNDTQTRLNLLTDWNIQPESNSFVTDVETANNTGGTNDLLCLRSNYSSNLTSRGVLSNLNKFQYFDWDNTAWSQSFIENCTINGKLYFATGDISTNLIFMTTVIFWNKDLVEDYQINEYIAETYEGNADLYDLVNNGEWTLDKMYALANRVYADTNTSGKKDEGDTFGLITYPTHVENIWYGGGYTTVEVDDGEFKLTQAFKDAQTIGKILSDGITNFFENDSCFYMKDHNPTRENFANGLALFAMAPASHAYVKHSTIEDLKYSVLPVPKHSVEQEKYASVQAFPYATYAIPTQSQKAEMASAFMQSFAVESVTSTRIALFDKMMKGRYSEDPIDADMWNQAIDANVFDLGRIFASYIGQDTSEQLTVQLFRKAFAAENSNWQGVLAADGQRTARFVNAITKEIEKIPD